MAVPNSNRQAATKIRLGKGNFSRGETKKKIPEVNIKYFHRPTISESLGNAWYTMKKYFLWLFLAIIISGIFQGYARYNFDTDSGFVMAPWIIFAVIIGIGIFALIIPGIVLACRLAFVSYLVMDKGLDPIQAVEESWRMTRGYGWTIFGLGFLSIFIAIAGLLCLIVGIFPAIIVISASFASLYQAILTEKEIASNPVSTGEVQNP
jgi:uncharacterized membrane protein